MNGPREPAGCSAPRRDDLASDPEVERAWLREVERRWNAWLAGDRRTYTIDEVFDELERELT